MHLYLQGLGSSVMTSIIQVLTLQDALSDPAVQAQILKVAQEKFPEAGMSELICTTFADAHCIQKAASAAKDKVLEWANDPEVHHPSANACHAKAHCAGAEASIRVCGTGS